MKSSVRIFLMLILFFSVHCPLSTVHCLYAASEDATVYFNAGTEKYLQGNFTEAVENLEHAQKLDPENPRIKEFIVKILIDAATQNHVSRNYRQAFEYIKKARAAAPDNPKVLEIYQLTSELLSPNQEKVAPRERRTTESLLPQEAAAVKKPETRRVRDAMRAKPPAAPAAPVIITHAAPVPAARQGYISDRLLPAVFGAAGAVVLLWVITMILFAQKSSRLKAATLRLSSLEEELRALTDANNKRLLELEKAKEQVKYEHQIAEQFHHEVKEKEKQAEDHIRTEIELRSQQIEHRIRAEMAQNREKDDSLQEAFLHQQQTKFLEYVGEMSINSDISSPAIEAARERIAAMAENLYEYAPGAALDFLGKMAANQNALIRANVIHALARIARPETLELLFKLYHDGDYRVKRETIKSLKSLHQKIESKIAFFDVRIQDRVRALLEDEKNKGEWIF